MKTPQGWKLCFGNPISAAPFFSACLFFMLYWVGLCHSFLAPLRNFFCLSLTYLCVHPCGPWQLQLETPRAATLRCGAATRTGGNASLWTAAGTRTGRRRCTMPYPRPNPNCRSAWRTLKAVETSRQDRHITLMYSNTALIDSFEFIQPIFGSHTAELGVLSVVKDIDPPSAWWLVPRLLIFNHTLTLTSGKWEEKTGNQIIIKCHKSSSKSKLFLVRVHVEWRQ